MSFDDLLSKLAKAKEAKAKIDAKVKDADRTVKELEDQILLQMQDAGTTMVRGGGLTVSIRTSEVPNVVDWDKFYAFVTRNKAYHLFERRVATSAWREMVESRKGVGLPGVNPFTRVSLNVHTGTS